MTNEEKFFISTFFAFIVGAAVFAWSTWVTMIVAGFACMIGCSIVQIIRFGIEERRKMLEFNARLRHPGHPLNSAESMGDPSAPRY